MQTNRKYINRTYSSPHKPQRIRLLPYSDVESFTQILLSMRIKINEIIEAIPNNYPVLIDVSQEYSESQIRVYGSVMLDHISVDIDETLSTLAPSNFTGVMYVNLLNDSERPVLQISPKFMENNWTTLYALQISGGKITNVAYNDIYAYMHNSDPNAHFDQFQEIRNYIYNSLELFFTEWGRILEWFIFDGTNHFDLTSNLSELTPDYRRFLYLDMIATDGFQSIYSRNILDYATVGSYSAILARTNTIDGANSNAIYYQELGFSIMPDGSIGGITQPSSRYLPFPNYGSSTGGGMWKICPIVDNRFARGDDTKFLYIERLTLTGYDYAIS